MRSFGHWTPRYVRDRLGVMAYQMLEPDAPWLTQSANRVLESLLRESDVGLEFGSGRSTRWLAGRIANLTSVEHDPSWANKVRSLLQAGGVRNVDFNMV